MTKSLVLGISGQTASYLAELLLEKGHEVFGIIRRSSSINTDRIDHLIYPEEKIKLFFGDVTDTNSIYKILLQVRPDEIYNASAMSHVKVSFEIPEYTFDSVALGVCRLLEAIKNLRSYGVLKKDVKFLQFSSSEMFGISPPPQSEKTQFCPVSPYGISKLAAYHFQRSYRFGYKMFSCGPICFNNESPRRGRTFVTQKIVYGAVRIKLRLEDKISLGNLEAKRDWGFSKDYCDAIFKIMQHTEPDDFVISTEHYYSVKEFAELVFKKLNLDFNEHLIISNQYFRPNEVPALKGDSTKAHDILHWHPKTSFGELVDMIIESAMKEEKQKLRGLECQE